MGMSRIVDVLDEGVLADRQARRDRGRFHEEDPENTERWLDLAEERAKGVV
nr:hypothetical protein NG677_06825 [Methylobacterium sp. OTU13CASTA1]